MSENIESVIDRFAHLPDVGKEFPVQPAEFAEILFEQRNIPEKVYVFGVVDNNLFYSKEIDDRGLPCSPREASLSSIKSYKTEYIF